MTKLRLAASSTLVNVVLSILAISLGSCTDAEQQKELDRQKRVEQQEQLDRESAARKAATQQAPTAPEPEQTPDAPAEPATTTYYYFTSNSEKTPVKCRNEGEGHECGVSFQGCGNDQADEYACQVGVHSWSKAETD